MVGVEFESLGDAVIIDGRPLFVRGSLLLEITPDPFGEAAKLFELDPSSVAGLYDMAALMIAGCLGTRSFNGFGQRAVRLLVGVGGTDVLVDKLGGVVDELVRLPGRRLAPLSPILSFVSLDLTSSLAILRTKTAPSISESR